MRSVLVLVALSAACSRAPASAPLAYAPSEVVEVGALPAGYRSGEALTESCLVSPRGSFEDEPLSDVDCSFARLSRALSGRAGERGAKFLVAKRCRGGAGPRPRLTCTASLAVPTEQLPLRDVSARSVLPAPSAEQVKDGDEPRPQDAARIRVSFRPSAASVGLPARAYDRVDETATPSVGRRTLGQVSARCASDCAVESLRHALRVTAGRVGAGEVSSVTCFEEGEGTRCVATALEPWSS